MPSPFDYEGWRSWHRLDPVQTRPGSTGFYIEWERVPPPAGLSPEEQERWANLPNPSLPTTRVGPQAPPTGGVYVLSGPAGPFYASRRLERDFPELLEQHDTLDPDIVSRVRRQYGLTPRQARRFLEDLPSTPAMHRAFFPPVLAAMDEELHSGPRDAPIYSTPPPAEAQRPAEAQPQGERDGVETETDEEQGGSVESERTVPTVANGHAEETTGERD